MMRPDSDLDSRLWIADGYGLLLMEYSAFDNRWLGNSIGSSDSGP